MKVYKLSFYKGGFRLDNPSISFLREVSEEEQQNLFFHFGAMDFMTVVEEKEFSNMVAYQTARYKKEFNNPVATRFLQETVYLLDTADRNNMLLMQQKKLRKSNLYLIYALKMNHTLMPKGKGNYSKLLTGVSDAVVNCLTHINEDETIKSIEHIQCFGSTGEHDFILICSSTSLKSLLAVKDVLRNITVNNTVNTETHKNEEAPPLFSSLQSYFVASDNLLPSNICNELCNVEIQISRNQNKENITKIVDEISSQFSGVGDIRISDVIGSNSENELLHILNVPVQNVLRIHPLWHDTDKFEIDEKSGERTYYGWYKDIHPRINTSFFVESTKLSPIPVELAFRECLPIEKLWEAIKKQGEILQRKNLIPDVSLHSFHVLVDTCHYLMHNPRQHNTSVRFACILYYAFKIIKERHKNLEPLAVSECLHELCMLVNMTMRSDSMQIDDMDENSLNPSNSISKFLYSFETMLRDAYDHISDENASNSVFLFLTIGLSELIESTFYFRTKPGTLKRYVSINMPCTQAFDLNYSLPYLYHELGHYVGIDEGDKNSRNEAYYEVIKRYITLYCYGSFLQSSGISSPSLVKDYFDSFFLLAPKPKMATQSLDHFISLVRKHIADCHHISVQVRVDEGMHSNDSLTIGIRSLTDDFGYLRLFDRLFRETHADIIMAVLGNLSNIGYLEALFRALHQKKLIPNIDNNYKKKQVWPNQDIEFHLRISVVLSVLKPEYSYKQYANKLEPDVFNFFTNSFDILYSTKRLLKPLVCYLREHIYDVLSKIDYTNPLSPNVKCGTLVSRFMELWYANTELWYEQAEKIIIEEMKEDL